MSFFGSSSHPAAAAAKDVEVADPPTDSVSSLAFSPAADFLAAGSWDNQVRIYQVGATGQAQGKAIYAHDGPVLSVAWSKDGKKVFSGSVDHTARAYDISTGQAIPVAQHDAPIRSVKWIDSPTGGILVTGGWDKTLKTPVGVVALSERCYSLDVAYPLMVVATAERHIQIFNLSDPTRVYRTIESPLKWQTRVVTAFHTAKGFAVGSVEGRIAMQFVEQKDSGSNYSFKCHRKEAAPLTTLVYAVNDIRFHPVHESTFSTGASDGTVSFWDRDARSRTKSFEPAAGPVTASAFSAQGTMFAYSVAYDWSKGHVGMVAGHPNKIMVHVCKDEEVKRRPPKK